MASFRIVSEFLGKHHIYEAIMIYIVSKITSAETAIMFCQKLHLERNYMYTESEGTVGDCRYAQGRLESSFVRICDSNWHVVR